MAGVGIPEELAGQGGGIVELALTAEELGRAGAPSAAWLATVLAVPALPTDRAEKALGGRPAALLVPAEELPVQAPTLDLDRQGRVSGTVPRVLLGGRAASYIAVVGDGAGRSLRLVEAGREVSATPRRLLDRSRPVADVHLDGASSVPLTGDVDEYLSR